MYVRKELQEYLKTYGVKQSFIAEKIGISESMISKFLKGERNLSKGKETALQKIIKR